MVTVWAPARTRLLYFIFFVSSLTELAAQCNPPDQLPGADCESAPLICLKNACYETQEYNGGGPSGWCNGSNTIENPQFFQFIPTDTMVIIEIHVDNCDANGSLQAGILEACPWDPTDVIACNGGTDPGGTITLIGHHMTIGQIYWLMLDGTGGSLCNYTITNVVNIYAPTIDVEIETAESIPYSVCQGFQNATLVAAPHIPLAHGYYWILEWNSQVLTSTLPEIEIDIPLDLDPGVYEICVGAYSGCDSSDQDFCFEIEVYEIPPENKEPAIFCLEEFPFSWGALTINGEGEYEQTFITPEGCRHDSMWIIEQYPEPEVGEIDTVHCCPQGELTFSYENETYDEAGMYELLYAKSDINGCDTSAQLNLTIIGIDAYVELTCENGEFVLTNYIEEIIPAHPELDYFWYEHAGGLVGDENPFYTLTPGCYDLWVRVTTNDDASCEFFIETVCFEGDDYYPPAPVFNHGDTVICAGIPVLFAVIPDFNEEFGLEYVWTYPAGVVLHEIDDGIVEMDFSNAASGIVCVHAIGMCGEGPSTCFEVDLLPAPVAKFSLDSTICAGDELQIVFTGSASSNANYNWDFNSPATLNGSGIGPYMVTWSLEGDKLIFLTVIKPGCDTATYVKHVMVSHLQDPLINCTSTINSILFDWDDLSGIISYTISLNGSTPITPSGSEYLDQPLLPGTMVEMILTAISGGPCPNVMDTIQCIAQNCPPPVILLSGEDSICLNNPTLVNLNALVNGSAGDGLWSGPGIVDGVNGIFDGKLSGAGHQQLTYTVDVNGCPFNEPFFILVFDSLTAAFSLDSSLCIADQTTLLYTGNGSDSAHYQFTFASANVLSGSGSGPYALSWNSAGSQSISLQVEENGCTSSVITHSTIVSPLLNAPVFNCSPNTSEVVFNWIGDAAALDFDTIVLTGHVGSVIGNELTFTGLNTNDTVGIVVITHGAGPCPDRIDTTYCVARNCPMPVIEITPVDPLCLYPEIGAFDIEFSVTNGNGSGEWTGAGVIDGVNGKFDPAIAGVGNHLLNYQYVDDGCTFNNPLTIQVNAVPIASISNTNLMITCATPSLVLDGSASIGNSLLYQWSSAIGTIIGSSVLPAAEVAAAGNYQLVVTDPTAGCKDSVSVTVTVDANIPMALAGIDRVLSCDSLQFTLGGNSTIGPDIIYLWSTVDGILPGSTNQLLITVNHAGEYNILVKDTITGCEAVDVTVVSIDTVVAEITFVVGDTIDCATTISGAMAFINEPASDYHFQWTTLNGLILGSDANEYVEVSQGGDYTVMIHNLRNGCETLASVVVAESEVIIDDVKVEEKQISCYGEQNGSLWLTGVEGGIPPYEYQWSVGNTGIDMLTGLPPGMYSLTVSDANGCVYIKTFILMQPDLVTLDIGPDLVTLEGDAVSIELNTPLDPIAIQEIQWNHHGDTSCTGCLSYDFIADLSGIISAMITDTAGCMAVDSLYLNVVVPNVVFIPNVFSPNGDQVNDYFFISGKSNLIRIGEMNIYDRWGNQVFSKKDITPGIAIEGWNGQFNGEPMMVGVYVYQARLEYENVTENLSGNLTLVR